MSLSNSSVASAPASFVAAINYVVNYYDTLFTNNVTINLNVGYGEVAGQTMGAGALGESYSPTLVSESYASVVSALQAEGAPGASALSSTSPLSGALYMTQTEAQALGLTNAVSTGYVGFSSSLPFSYTANATPASNAYYFIGAAEHEITEVMGRASLIDGQPGYYALMDLYRFTAASVHDTTAGGSGSTAYFSINNGVTNLGTWNNSPANGDLGDWYPSGPAAGGNDSFNDYTSPGVINVMSANDVTLMQALGWTTQPAQPSGSIAVTANTMAALQGGAAGYASGECAVHHRFGEHNACECHDQDRKWQRQRRRRRRALRQWRAERFGRQRRHGELERRYRHADVDRQRNHCGLSGAAK